MSTVSPGSPSRHPIPITTESDTVGDNLELLTSGSGNNDPSTSENPIQQSISTDSSNTTKDSFKNSEEKDDSSEKQQIDSTKEGHDFSNMENMEVSLSDDFLSSFKTDGLSPSLHKDDSANGAMSFDINMDNLDMTGLEDGSLNAEDLDSKDSQDNQNLVEQFKNSLESDGTQLSTDLNNFKINQGEIDDLVNSLPEIQPDNLKDFKVLDDNLKDFKKMYEMKDSKEDNTTDIKFDDIDLKESSTDFSSNLEDIKISEPEQSSSTQIPASTTSESAIIPSSTASESLTIPTVPTTRESFSFPDFDRSLLEQSMLDSLSLSTTTSLEGFDFPKTKDVGKDPISSLPFEIILPEPLQNTLLSKSPLSTIASGSKSLSSTFDIPLPDFKEFKDLKGFNFKDFDLKELSELKTGTEHSSDNAFQFKDLKDLGDGKDLKDINLKDLNIKDIDFKGLSDDAIMSEINFSETQTNESNSGINDAASTTLTSNNDLNAPTEKLSGSGIPHQQTIAEMLPDIAQLPDFSESSILTTPRNQNRAQSESLDTIVQKPQLEFHSMSVPQSPNLSDSHSFLQTTKTPLPNRSKKSASESATVTPISTPFQIPLLNSKNSTVKKVQYSNRPIDKSSTLQAINAINGGQLIDTLATGDTSKSELENVPRVSAYARLDFPSFTFYVQTLQVILGRGAESGGSVVDVDLGSAKAISRKHAKIFYNFGTQRFELSVLGRNGAFVDDKFVETGSTVPLKDGIKIQIGQISFSFILPSSGGSGDSSAKGYSQKEKTGDSGDNPDSEKASPNLISHTRSSSVATELDNAELKPLDTEKHVNSETTSDSTTRSSKTQSTTSNLNPPAVTKTETSANESQSSKETTAATGQKPVNNVPVKTKTAQKEYLPEEIPEEYREKPQYSYSHLIATALRAHPNESGISLSKIYKSIQDIFPYYQYCPHGWKNSVRHNLSSNKAFKKISKEGKGWLWGIDEEYFQERERIRKKAAQNSLNKAKAAAEAAKAAQKSAEKAASNSSASTAKKPSTSLPGQLQLPKTTIPSSIGTSSVVNQTQPLKTASTNQSGLPALPPSITDLELPPSLKVHFQQHNIPIPPSSTSSNISSNSQLKKQNETPNLTDSSSLSTAKNSLPGSISNSNASIASTNIGNAKNTTDNSNSNTPSSISSNTSLAELQSTLSLIDSKDKKKTIAELAREITIDRVSRPDYSNMTRDSLTVTSTASKPSVPTTASGSSTSINSSTYTKFPFTDMPAMPPLPATNSTSYYTKPSSTTPNSSQPLSSRPSLAAGQTTFRMTQTPAFFTKPQTSLPDLQKQTSVPQMKVKPQIPNEIFNNASGTPSNQSSYSTNRVHAPLSIPAAISTPGTSKALLYSQKGQQSITSLMSSIPSKTSQASTSKTTPLNSNTQQNQSFNKSGVATNSSTASQATQSKTPSGSSSTASALPKDTLRIVNILHEKVKDTMQKMGQPLDSQVLTHVLANVITKLTKSGALAGGGKNIVSSLTSGKHKNLFVSALNAAIVSAKKMQKNQASAKQGSATPSLKSSPSPRPSSVEPSSSTQSLTANTLKSNVANVTNSVSAPQVASTVKPTASAVSRPTTLKVPPSISQVDTSSIPSSIRIHGTTVPPTPSIPVAVPAAYKSPIANTPATTKPSEALQTKPISAPSLPATDVKNASTNGSLPEIKKEPDTSQKPTGDVNSNLTANPTGLPNPKVETENKNPTPAEPKPVTDNSNDKSNSTPISNQPTSTGAPVGSPSTSTQLAQNSQSEKSTVNKGKSVTKTLNTSTTTSSGTPVQKPSDNTGASVQKPVPTVDGKVSGSNQPSSKEKTPNIRAKEIAQMLLKASKLKNPSPAIQEAVRQLQAHALRLGVSIDNLGGQSSSNSVSPSASASPPPPSSAPSTTTVPPSSNSAAPPSSSSVSSTTSIPTSATAFTPNSNDNQQAAITSGVKRPLENAQSSERQSKLPKN